MKISDYVESQIKGLWGTDFDENGIPVIKTNNLTYEGHIDYSDICKRNITREHAKECYLKPGDLLIEKSGGTKTHSVGYVSYFEGDENKFVCNNFILALRLKNTINSKFLFYQIQFKYESNQFSDCFNKTTGIQNLKVKDYLAKEIKIYSPEEQEKIVKELDTVRSTINKNKQILEKYDTLIKSRFIEMFGDNPIENGKWKVEKLGNLGLCKNGMNFSYEDNGFEINCLGVGDFKDNAVISNCEKLPVISLNEKPSEEYLLKDNDIVFVRSNGNKELVGRSVLVHPRVLTTFSGFCIRFRLSTDSINHLFLLQFLKMPNTRKNMAGRGANIQNLNQQILSNLDIPVPQIELQNDFASFVQQIDKSKFAVQKALEKAETLYKSLMQRYFA